MKAANNIHESMVVDILQTAAIIDHKLNQLFRGFGLTHAQYSIMRVLQGATTTGLTIGDLKLNMIPTNSDITRLIDRLEQKKLVSRRNCENNRRRIYVNITGKGITLLDTIEPELNKTLNSFYKNVYSDQSAKSMSQQLRKIQQLERNENN